MKIWTAKLWLVFVGAIVIILGIVAYFTWVYVVADVIWQYCIFFVAICSVLGVISLILRKSHSIHIHHYNIGMVAVALIGYRSIPALIF